MADGDSPPLLASLSTATVSNDCGNVAAASHSRNAQFMRVLHVRARVTRALVRVCLCCLMHACVCAHAYSHVALAQRTVHACAACTRACVARARASVPALAHARMCVRVCAFARCTRAAHSLCKHVFCLPLGMCARLLLRHLILAGTFRNHGDVCRCERRTCWALYVYGDQVCLSKSLRL